MNVVGQLRLISHIVYESLYGDLPPGTIVRHTCDNPKCVNPYRPLLLGPSGEVP